MLNEVTVIILAILSLLAWLFLLLLWGDFWRADLPRDSDLQPLTTYPTVRAIVPARDEAEIICASLTSLLKQDYPGELAVVVVDDNSSDRTAEIARQTAVQFERECEVIAGKPLADGWKGKVWAMHQGIEYWRWQETQVDYFLFTDADIKHDSNNLMRLVTKAERENLDLVSLMVSLRCQSFWEKLLIPAFVFFFQKLYPFAWVNSPQKAIAAAAGGCILISREAVSAVGGISAIKNALIDDCTLAHLVKSRGQNIWLGLSNTTVSIRGYDNLKAIWDTVARTAYTQLNYSPLLLVATVIGMILIYLTPPFCLTVGILTGNWTVIGISAVTYLLAILAYLPTIKLYNLSPAWASCLPAIAFLYTLMTVDSAIEYYRGKGGAWKGRTY